MRGRISEEIVEQIRSQVDILEVVQKHVELKKRGKYYFGLCPFHSEKSPSFSVSPDKQIYHCFGCKVGGDGIQFLMELEQLSFYEAIRYLADQMGIEVPESSQEIPDEEDRRRAEMRKALELAAKMFHYVLKSTDFGKRARHYLHTRQIQAKTIDDFQMGYAPDSFDFILSFLKKRGFDERLLEEIGLVAKSEKTKKYYDRFRNRIMFPIHDSSGKVIGFGGRTLDRKGPKYLNTPETRLFHKGKFLFNFHRARALIRRKQRAVLFEGYLDVISAWQAGIKDAVATLGTALTEQQAKLLSRNTEMALLCYDADPAGQQAAMKGIGLLKEMDCVVKVAQMPIDLDPDDYIQRYGGTRFQEEILGRPLSSIAFQLESKKKAYEMQDEDQRMRYIGEALTIISKLPRAVERDHYIRGLADEFRLSVHVLKEDMRRISKQKAGKGNQKRHGTSFPVSTSFRSNKVKHSIGEQSERLLIAHMMRSREVTMWVKQHIGAGFHIDYCAALAAYLYSYYEEQSSSGELSRFLHYLPDQQLRSRASELAMTELPEEVMEEELRDYAYQIEMATIKKQIEQKNQLVEQLAKTNPLQAAKISTELLILRKQLKEAKKNA